MSRQVLILHTGGTLGMVGGVSGPLQLASSSDGEGPLSVILRRIPELAEIADLRVEILARQDSCDVTADQWQAWARRIREEDRADGIVLIHGTDSMAYSASVLSFLLEERHRPIVLTGSQRPLSEVRTDARQNLIDAVTLATGPLSEVMVCFDSEGLRGNRTLKRSATAMGAFESPCCPPLVSLGVDIRWNDHGLTSSGEARRLVVGNAVRLSWVMPDLPAPGPWEPPGPAVRVLACLGAGNVPLHAGWQQLVRDEVANGVIHLVVSQCPHGGVHLGLYPSSQQLLEAGAVDGSDLTYIAAVAKARVGLGQDFDRSALIRYLELVVAGERTTSWEAPMGSHS